MLFCHQCNVTILGSFKRCPLCSGSLSGTADETTDVFPPITPVLKPFKRLISLIAFGTIVVAVISVAVDIAVGKDRILWWSLFVIAGLASLWLSFFIANNRWWNIPKSIFLQLLVLSVMEIVWDYFTGFHKWSFNYVIPIMFTCSMIALSILAMIRKLRTGDYMLILFVISMISVCSLLLIIFHVVTVIYPALICFTFSIISSARIVLFEGRSLLEELKRRTHV